MPILSKTLLNGTYVESFIITGFTPLEKGMLSPFRTTDISEFDDEVGTSVV